MTGIEDNDYCAIFLRRRPTDRYRSLGGGSGCSGRRVRGPARRPGVRHRAQPRRETVRRLHRLAAQDRRGGAAGRSRERRRPGPHRCVGGRIPGRCRLSLHEDAGRPLRRWHDASAPGTDADRAAVRSDLEDQAQEAADCLEHLASHLADDRLALVEAASTELAGLAEQLPLVYRHGDFETRNWLYDQDTGRHRPGPASFITDARTCGPNGP
ncbi:phosphotransferase [Kitasatospora sp. NPDC005748]|uniref:phosphotransferase n=1 Tax=Kitasatospora sp. NPDC005748 TaxID=3157063 RepID=UPI0033EF9F5F